MGRRRRHPGNIERRGNSLRVRLTVNGERHYFTLKTTDRSVAEKFAREEERELRKKAEREVRATLGQLKFSKLLDRFDKEIMPTLTPGTKESYSGAFKIFRTFFVKQRGDPPLEKIRPADVRSFLAWRKSHRADGGKGGVSNHTVAKDRRVLHRLFEFAWELELVDGNPVARVDAPSTDERTPYLLSEEELGNLLKRLEHKPMARLWVLTLAETGARAYTEVLRLRWEDVDLAGSFIQIVSGRDGERTKTGKSRWVPMTPTLEKEMKEHFARWRFAQYGEPPAPSPWVFHHTKTLRSAVAGKRYKDPRAIVETAIEDAGIPDDFRIHDLRHRRVTKWLAEGKNAVHVKEAVGHADLKTTMDYTHLAREHLRSLVDEPEDQVSEEKRQA